MSEPENFLTRWSRRKQEAEHERETTTARPREGGDPKPKDETAEKAALDSRLRGNEQGETTEQDKEPLFDLSKLPSLDSITADTDVRVFLQKGVPAELTRAALRRAWTSDPAIRDFIEVAENQWDFATGSDIPGFGPLEASEELRRMVSSMFEPPAKPSVHAAAPSPENTDDRKTDARATSSETEGDDTSVPSTSGAAENVPTEQAENIAAQQESHDHESAAPARKRHGSALPE